MTRKHRDERRSEIIAAMRRLLPERGYDRTTIAAIAQEAEMNPGLVHYHFRNKLEILVALVDSLFQVLRGRYEAFLGPPPHSPKQSVEAFVDAHLATKSPAGSTIEDGREAMRCWVAVACEATKRPEVQQVFGRALGVSAKILRAQLEELIGPGPRSRQLAGLIMSSIYGAYLLDGAVPGLNEPGFAAPAVRHLLENALAETQK